MENISNRMRFCSNPSSGNLIEKLYMDHGYRSIYCDTTGILAGIDNAIKVDNVDSNGTVRELTVKEKRTILIEAYAAIKTLMNDKHFPSIYFRQTKFNHHVNSGLVSTAYLFCNLILPGIIKYISDKMKMPYSEVLGMMSFAHDHIERSPIKKNRQSKNTIFTTMAYESNRIKKVFDNKKYTFLDNDQLTEDLLNHLIKEVFG